MVGRICPPGWDRVKVSENLGAVAPVAPADTSLLDVLIKMCRQIFNPRYRYILCIGGWATFLIRCLMTNYK